MVLKHLLLNQGMVATQPLVPKNPSPTPAVPPIDPGVYHLKQLHMAQKSHGILPQISKN